MGVLDALKEYWGIMAALATGFAGMVMGRERTRYQVESVSDRIGAFEARLRSVEDQGHENAQQMAAVKAELGMLPEMRSDIKDILMVLGGRK